MWQPIETAPKDGRPVRLFDPTRPWSKTIDLLGVWTGSYWRRIDRRGFLNMRVFATHWQPPTETP